MPNTITFPEALNGICPYFTMFPLKFPLSILRRRANKNDTVLDPFCGRGTTNFAARLVGLGSLGVDSSPVATAITSSKIVETNADGILVEAKKILASRRSISVPQGEFWELAFHADVLESLCRYREAFLKDCSSPERTALRGLILGALHGPKQKTSPSYFSNQCPRTYAPKPLYATRFWKERNQLPEPISVLDVIKKRANRYFLPLHGTGASVRLADSRTSGVLTPDKYKSRFNWVITSPPYYGMRTYIPDQWLRNWFVGGSDTVDYSAHGQLIHSSPDVFASELRQVWNNAAEVCDTDANLVIRFGGIPDKKVDPLHIIKQSLVDSGWKITTIHQAGTAKEGHRQADSFLKNRTKPLVEYDVWAVKK